MICATPVSMVSLEIRLVAVDRRLRVRNATVMVTLTRMPYRIATLKPEIASSVFTIPEMAPRISASFAKLVTMGMLRHIPNLDANVSQIGDQLFM